MKEARTELRTRDWGVGPVLSYFVQQLRTSSFDAISSAVHSPNETTCALAGCFIKSKKKEAGDAVQMKPISMTSCYLNHRKLRWYSQRLRGSLVLSLVRTTAFGWGTDSLNSFPNCSHIEDTCMLFFGKEGFHCWVFGRFCMFLQLSV